MSNAAKTFDLAAMHQMSGPQLVELHNEMVATWYDLQGDNSFGTVKRFSAADAGRVRCHKLHAAIEARRAELGEALAETGRDLRPPFLQAGTELPAGDPGAVDEAAREGTPHYKPDAAAGDQTAAIGWDQLGDTPQGQANAASWSSVTGGSESEGDDDMAKKRKAGRKAPRKAGAARRTEGPTLASYREEFNSLVPQAKKLGLKFKHHTSEFESKAKGAAQVARLKKAIAGAK